MTRLKNILGFALLLISACSSNPSAPIGGGLALGEVVPLNFQEQSQVQLQVDELSGDEEFALILFGSNPESTTSFQLFSDPAPLALQLEDSKDDEDSFITETYVSSSDWEVFLRGEEKKLQHLMPYQAGDKLENQQDYKNIALGDCAQGLGQWFKVLKPGGNTSDYQKICGLLRHSSANAQYYVDQEVSGAINDSTLSIAIEAFEARIDSVRSILGEESDIDNNGSFYVLFTPAVNRLGSKSNSIVTGFFFAGDLYSELEVSSSNEAEVLYMSVPNEDPNLAPIVSESLWKSNLATTVLTHEFQHLVNFNQKVLLSGGEVEDAWANEGLSHFFEDLSPGGDFDQIGVENPSRVSYFLTTPEEAYFTQGLDLPKRGALYLLFRYLYEQAEQGQIPGSPDGKTLLRRLVQSPHHGVENIENVTGLRFEVLLSRFYTAVQLSSSDLESDPLYRFQKICLTCAQDDHRGTQLNGIQNQELSQIPSNFEVKNPAPLFLKVKGGLLKNQDQLFNIESSSQQAGGAFIRIY